MLEQVLRFLRNWFPLPQGKHFGRYVIEDGVLSCASGSLPALQAGQCFRVLGSVFSDGVYRHPAKFLHDETFRGAVWALAVPNDVLALAEEIAAWQEANGAASASPYASESMFGQYSYTKATDGATGGAVTWQSAFSGRLSQWRKL